MSLHWFIIILRYEAFSTTSYTVYWLNIWQVILSGEMGVCHIFIFSTFLKILERWNIFQTRSYLLMKYFILKNNSEIWNNIIVEAFTHFLTFTFLLLVVKHMCFWIKSKMYQNVYDTPSRTPYKENIQKW